MFLIIEKGIEQHIGMLKQIINIWKFMIKSMNHHI